MVLIQLPVYAAFLCEDFLHLVRNKFSFALSVSTVTPYEFGAIKVQIQFYILADSSPPFLFSFIPSPNYLNKKQSNDENIYIHTKDYQQD